MSSLKYWLGGTILLVIFLVVMNYSFFIHTSNVDSTSQVDTLDNNMALGVFRGEVDDKGDLNPQQVTLNVKEIEDNLISRVAVKQKANRNDIRIIYTFVDKDGKEVDVSNTNNHPKVRGIQYGVVSIEDNISNGEVDVSLAEKLEIQNIATEQDDYIPLDEL